MRFLGFFDDNLKLKTKDANGKYRACLDCFGDVMAARMEHSKHDRDLVVMRHNFILENEKKERWGHTSTWIESGAAAVTGGYSIMSKSVGVTSAISARLVLEGKITNKGVVSPIYPGVYNPIMKILDRDFGIVMIEESERADGLPVSVPRPKL
jgi:saccharopine dehydrogenase (NADP+, L-glutamate forming)